jgi:hypothetical protein
MKGISQTRLIIYSLIIGLVPLLFVGMNYTSQKASQDRLATALSEAITNATNKNAKEFVNKQVKAQYRDSNHFYIDQEIETISPLKDELQTLNRILSLGFHAQEDQFRRRLQWHTGGQNKISFVEGNVKAYSDFQETQESLAHTVECDLNDIKAILSRIEGVSFDANDTLPPNRPHLIIVDWKMEKKKSPTQDVYGLDVKLIKREYLK